MRSTRLRLKIQRFRLLYPIRRSQQKIIEKNRVKKNLLLFEKLNNKKSYFEKVKKQNYFRIRNDWKKKNNDF